MSTQLGRPREFDEDEVLSEIMSAFWRNGYEGTGLAQIIAATGLKKGSLYKAFENKHDMYLKALKHYEKTAVDPTVKFLTSDSAAPLERVKSYLSAPIDAVWDKNDSRGCFLCNASADYAAHDDDTRALVARGYRKMERALMVPIKQLNPKWTQSKLESAAQHCLSVYAGLRIMSRASVDRKRLEGARDACLATLT